jgi:glycosyltransferase involved in cell wall biosynthesis
VNQGTLTIIMPVQQHPGKLADTVTGWMRAAARSFADCEFILIDDGGGPAIAAEVDRLAATHEPVMVLHYRHTRGFAFALRDAWRSARGDYLLAIDPSGAPLPSDLERLAPYVEHHAVVLAARTNRPAQPLARMFAATVRRQIDATLRDPAYRLVLFRQEVRTLLEAVRRDDLIHAEIYAAARSAGMPVVQVDLPGRRPAGVRSRLHSLRENQIPALVDETGGRMAPSGVTLGVGALLAAGGVWLLRRLRPSRR